MLLIIYVMKNQYSHFYYYLLVVVVVVLAGPSTRARAPLYRPCFFYYSAIMRYATYY